MKSHLYHANWEASIARGIYPMNFYNDKGIDQLEAMASLAQDGLYEWVADLDLVDHEEVFKNTQNWQEPWRKRDPTRSTSMGDVIIQYDSVYVCALIGWDDVTKNVFGQAMLAHHKTIN